MTLKATLKKHSKKIIVTTAVVASVGSAAIITSLLVRVDTRTLMLRSAMDVIEDLGGNSSTLMAEKLISYQTPFVS